MSRVAQKTGKWSTPNNQKNILILHGEVGLIQIFIRAWNFGWRTLTGKEITNLLEREHVKKTLVWFRWNFIHHPFGVCRFKIQNLHRLPTINEVESRHTFFSPVRRI